MADEQKTNCFVLMCGGFASLSVLAGSIAYVVFGVMFLINDYNECKHCSKSHLWEYVLVALILSVTHAGVKKNKGSDENEGGMGTVICICLIDAGLAIWGGIELFIKACDEVESSKIWTYALVTFSIQVLVVIIVLVCVPIAACCIALNANNGVASSQENTIV